MNQVGGMSDLCTYELEDIAWDELDQINDHIVPHPSNKNENETAYLQDEEIFTKYVNQEEEGYIQPQKKKRTKLLRKGQNTSITDIVDADGTISGEECIVNDTCSCAYPLGEISQTENDLIFWDKDHKDDESSDLLNYGWPDIENFDDVERILRSCDSNLEFGSSNEDNLAWLHSTQKIEYPSFSPFKNLPEENSSTLENASVSDPLGNFTFMDESPIPKMAPKEQQGVQLSSGIHFNNSTAYESANGNGQKNKHASRPNLSVGEKKVLCKSRQVFAHPDHQNQYKNTAPNNFGYLQTHTPYMHLNYQNSVGSPLSNIKSEINSLTSFSPGESSYASSQAQTMESSHRHPFSAPVMSVDEKLEKLRRRQDFIVHHSRNYSKNNSGIERANVTKDSGSPNVMETSCNNSGVDEMSLEISSFRQLQQVIEQLDIRTKLCIRNSLYRLARSAEQRHRYANITGGGQTGEAGDAFMADASDKGFMDMETDTNPIDRTVAHLLFHRPSDPSAMPARDGSSLKSHTMINGSMSSPPVMVDQLVCCEEAASKAGLTVSVTDDG